ncbi:MAG: D-alanine--D-alanine ligase [Coriobacteriia bacterium]|nr:D-alanine--D-alanine ligase [Coriobacteriia bacterium]
MAETFDPKSCKVALLAGGRSGEREISITSGKGSRQALEEAGFPVTTLDPAKKEDLVELINGDYDVAFLCTHGRYGEDGVLQGMLELIDLPYTGSGVWASAVAMDKSKAKLFYQRAGVDTPASVTLRKGEPLDAAAIVEQLGEHSVVKAACEGSTLGIYVVTQGSALEDAINQAFEFDNTVVVEQFVEGNEYTVAVLGNEDAQALPVINIVPAKGFYDFEAKYAPGGSEHICPAPISEELTATLQQNAVRAHKALECTGVSRTDFIVDANGKAWALETNTLPGMTGTSLLPDAARVAGMSFPQLCTKMVQDALAAHPRA